MLAWDYVKANVPAVAARYPTTRPENWLVKKLLDLPVVNELVDSDHRRANSAPFALGSASDTSLVNKNLTAVLCQVTGMSAPACDKCCRQHGLWQGCVRAPNVGPVPLIPGGACSNCAYNGRARDCQTTSQPAVNMPAPQFVQPAQPPIHGHQVHNTGGNEEEEEEEDYDMGPGFDLGAMSDEDLRSPHLSSSPAQASVSVGG